MSSPKPGDRTRPLFEEVLAHFLQEEERGGNPDPLDYLRRFPELAGELASFFRDRTRFDRAADDAGLRAGPAAGNTFGGYVLREVLGQGGMGLVYHASQREPAREVALKIVRADRLHGLDEDQRRDWLTRFRREAEVIASLGTHANITPLFDFGEIDGQAYFTMPLIRGGDLAARIRRGQDETTRQWAARRKDRQRDSAELVRRVALAVHHAHQLGVLHRDLKPANILLDESGEPIVTDFGLARRLGPDPASASGIIGTAAYMAPEQARGGRQAVSVAADVYSLGAILYEMLTGRPPFDAESPLETMLQAQDSPVPPPESFTPGLDRDLALVCLKCLEKEPHRRYASAGQLAADLENWRYHRPLIARPTGPLERLWLFARRRPAPVASAALVALTVLVSFPLVLLSRERAVRLAEENGQLAQEKEKEAGLKEQEAVKARQERDKADHRAATLALDRGVRLSQQGNRPEGLLWLARCLELAPPDGEELRRAARVNLARWSEPMARLKAVLPHDDEVLAVAYSPDGTRLVTGSADRHARLWDAATGLPVGKPLPHRGKHPKAPEEPDYSRPGQVLAVAVAPDGKTLVCGLTNRLGRPRQPIYQVGLLSALSPRDTNRMNTGLGSGFGTDFQHEPFPAVLWDVSTGKCLFDPWDGWGGKVVWALAVSRDGKRLVTGIGDLKIEDPADMQMPFRRNDPFGGSHRKGGAIVWDLAKRTRGFQSMSHENAVVAVAISDDGHRVLTGSADRTARVWDAESCRPLTEPLHHPGPVVAVAFHPDGKTFVTATQVGTRGYVATWSATTGQPNGSRPVEINEPALCLAFSPDGGTLAVGGGDPQSGRGFVQTWDFPSLRPLGPPIVHPAAVQALAYAPDGLSLLTACGDRTARLWDILPAEAGRADRNIGPLWAVAPAGGRLLGTVNGLPRVHDLKSGDAVGPALDGTIGIPEKKLQGKKRPPIRAWLSDDGRSVVTAHTDGNPFGLGGLAYLVVQDADGRCIGEAAPHRGEPLSVALSPNSDRLAFVIAGPHWSTTAVWLWDLIAGKPLNKPAEWPRHARIVAFSPDGKTLAVGGIDGQVFLYDAASGAARGRPLEHRGAVRAIVFTPDGRSLITGSADQSARRWDVGTGAPVGPALPMQGEVGVLAVSRDGRRMVAGGQDRTARLWDLRQDRAVGALLEHGGELTAAAFSPDGAMVATGSSDRMARLWDAQTGTALGPPFAVPGTPVSVGFTPDGDRLCVLSWDKGDRTSVLKRVGNNWERAEGSGADLTLRLWAVPRLAEGSTEEVVRRVGAITGSRLDADGVVRPLDVGELRRVRESAPARTPAERTRWNEARAAAAEAQEEWRAVRWHLDRRLAAGPATADLLTRRSRSLLRLEEVSAASADADAALRLAGDDGRCWHARAEVRMVRHQWKEALVDLTRAVELDGGDQGKVYDLATAHAQLGQWAEAEKTLARSTAMAPNDPDVALGLATLAARAGDKRRWQQVCLAMLGRVRPPADRGGTPGRMTRFEYDASGALSRVITDDPSGQTLTQLERPGGGWLPSGVQQTRTQPAFSPVMAREVAWLCCLEQLDDKQAEAALELARAAAKGRERDYAMARAMAAAELRAGRADAARKSLETTLTLRKTPSPVSVWLLLALAHDRLKEPEKADEYREKAARWIESSKRLAVGEEGDVIGWQRLSWREQVMLELLLAQAARKN